MGVRSAGPASTTARRETSTFLAALRVTGLTAPGVFDGAIDGASFLAYIEQILVPTLAPGDIVIADNLEQQALDSLAHRARTAPQVARL